VLAGILLLFLYGMPYQVRTGGWPQWVDDMEVFKWIAGTVILALGVWIAFLQWRTAKQKQALELNDRRFKLYESVKSCVDQFNRNSQYFDSEQEIKFLKALSEADFYFNDELHNYLETLRKDILTVRDIDKQVARLQQRNERINSLAKLGAKRDQAMNHINKFYEVGQAKFASSRPRGLWSKLVKFFRPIP
jgi:hypothetical protein